MSRSLYPHYMDRPILDPSGRKGPITDGFNSRLRKYIEENTRKSSHGSTIGSDFEHWDAGTTSTPNGWCSTGTGMTIARAAAPEGVPGYAAQMDGSDNNGYVLALPGRQIKVGVWYNLSYWIKVTTDEVEVDVAYVDAVDAVTVLESRVHKASEDSGWVEIPSGERHQPFGFRLEPGTAQPKRMLFRFRGNTVSTTADWTVAGLDIQEGVFANPSIHISKRYEMQPGGAQSLMQPLKVPMGQPYVVDNAFDTVNLPHMGVHKGTRVAKLQNGQDDGVQFNFQLPFDWTFGNTSKALNLVFTMAVPTAKTSTTIRLKVHNKYLSSNDNDSIDIAAFGSTSTGDMDIAEDWTAYQMHTESHQVTSDSPAAAGTFGECSIATVVFVREGSDAADTYANDLWLIWEKCYAYWSLTDDVTSHYGTDVSHPRAIIGDYCSVVGD